jgi:type IV secretory pathway component VirB8
MAAVLKDTPVYTDQVIAWQNQRLWWLLCGVGAMLILSLTANVVIELKPVAPPYVLVVDRRGQPVGKLQPVTSTQAIPEQRMEDILTDFIHKAFSITMNWDEEKYDLQQTYAMMPKGSQAEKQLTDWYQADKANNPLKAYRQGWQTVEIVRTLKLPAADTYEIDYRTVYYSNSDNAEPTTNNWRAVMHVQLGQVTGDESSKILIDDLSFAKDEEDGK